MADDAATPSECARFLKVCGGDQAAADKMVASYVKWRKEDLAQSPSFGTFESGLPPLAAYLPCKCLKGNRVFLIYGAMIDESRGTAKEFAAAVAKLLENGLDRNSDEQVTIVIDVRGGGGFANPNALKVVPFINVIMAIIGPYFPERIHMMYIVPIPWIAKAVWASVSSMLDPKMREKCKVIAGGSSRTDPMPPEMITYLDQTALDALASHRDSQVMLALAAQAVRDAEKAAEKEALASQRSARGSFGGFFSPRSSARKSTEAKPPAPAAPAAAAPAAVDAAAAAVAAVDIS